MTGGPIRPDPSDGMQRFLSAQRILVRVFVSVVAGTLIGAVAIITGFSTASVMLWSGVASSIISGIVLSTFGGTRDAWHFLASSWRQSRIAATTAHATERIRHAL